MVIGHHNLCKYIAKGLCTKLQSQLQASSSQSQPQTQGYSSSSSVSVSLSSSSCAFSSPPSSWGRWLWSRRWTGVSTTAAIDFLAPLAILRPELTVMVRLEAAASSTWKGGVMKMLGCPPWRRRRWGWQGHPCPSSPSRCWAGWRGWPRPPWRKSWPLRGVRGGVEGWRGSLHSPHLGSFYLKIRSHCGTRPVGPGAPLDKC